jgi:hypothetical protein
MVVSLEQWLQNQETKLHERGRADLHVIRSINQPSGHSAGSSNMNIRPTTLHWGPVVLLAGQSLHVPRHTSELLFAPEADQQHLLLRLLEILH